MAARGRSVSVAAAVASPLQVAHIPQGPVVGTQILTPVQQWFFANQTEQPRHWNQSVLLDVREPLDLLRLQTAVQQVLAQHDALRLQFREQAGQWTARYVPLDSSAATDLLWTAQVHSSEALQALCDEAQRSLSLHDGPLLRAVLIDHEQGAQRLLLVIHHLVVDGVSWRVLLEDLQAAYAGQALVEKTSALQDWARQLSAYAQSPALMAERDSWLQQLQDASARLPHARTEASQALRHRQVVSLGLDRAQTRHLLQQAPAAYRTQINDLLLTALARALCDWTGDATALIQLEGHGREDLFAGIDLTRTVGWFTSLFPVKLTPAAGMAMCLACWIRFAKSYPPFNARPSRFLRDSSRRVCSARKRAWPTAKRFMHRAVNTRCQCNHCALRATGDHAPGGRVPR